MYIDEEEVEQMREAKRRMSKEELIRLDLDILHHRGELAERSFRRALSVQDTIDYPIFSEDADVIYVPVRISRHIVRLVEEGFQKQIAHCSECNAHREDICPGINTTEDAWGALVENQLLMACATPKQKMQYALEEMREVIHNEQRPF